MPLKPQERKERTELKKIFEEIMADIFPNLVKGKKCTESRGSVNPKQD